MILFQSYQAQVPSKPGNLVTGKKRAAVTVRWALLSAASQLPRPSCVENEGHIAIIAIKLPWSFFVVILTPSQLGNLASPHQIQLHRNHLSIAPCQLLPIVNRSRKAVKVMILGQLKPLCFIFNSEIVQNADVFSTMKHETFKWQISLIKNSDFFEEVLVCV